MAREHARIKLSIWEDPDFRALDADAQHLYLVLLTSPQLNYCGVTDWRERRIAQAASDWTAERVAAAGRRLAEALYLVIDEGSEEALVRSFIRNDRLLESPNMAKAVARAYGAVASAALRGVVVHELRRLQAERPELTDSWPHLATVVDREAMDPRDYLTELGWTPSGKGSENPSGSPSENESRSPSGKGSENGSDTATPTPSDNPSGRRSATPVPSPAPVPGSPSSSQGQGRRKRRTQLPENWKPSAADVAWQRDEGITDDVARRELGRFADHWRSTGEPKADWSATWRNWLRRKLDNGGGARGGNGSADQQSSPEWKFG